MKWIDNRSVVPESISASDMFFKSVVITNPGSIRRFRHHMAHPEALEKPFCENENMPPEGLFALRRRS